MVFAFRDVLHKQQRSSGVKPK